MATLTIDRSKWRVGGGEDQIGKKKYAIIGATRLLNAEGFLCCLGFGCLQSGLNEEKILYRIYPEYLINTDQDVFGLTNNGRSNSNLSNKAASINDNDQITNEDREIQLTALFNEHGHEVIFTGEYHAAYTS